MRLMVEYAFSVGWITCYVIAINIVLLEGQSSGVQIYLYGSDLPYCIEPVDATSYIQYMRSRFIQLDRSDDS